MSKLLSKFLQIVIFPTALLVVSKVLGLYIAVMYFNLNFFLETHPEEIYSLQIYFTNSNETLIANSVSNLVMFCAIASVAAYFLIKYRLSLLATYNPRTLVKLNNWNMLSWVNKKDSTFLKVFVWTMFLWITSILIIVDVISQNTVGWIGIFAFVVTIISTWVLIRTFEIEGEIIYPHSETSNLY